MRLDELIDVGQLNDHIANGFINVRPHPADSSYKIYCYSKVAQIRWVWDDITIALRGLITHNDEIIARPFGKFFTDDQHFAIYKKLPQGHATIFEKVDGSIGILYPFGDGYAISSKSSFDSDQAIWATNWLNNNIDFDLVDFNSNYTYIFEMIYPQNRIVVDYGSYEGLILLEVLDTETQEIVHEEFQRMGRYFSTPRVYMTSEMDLADLSTLYQTIPEGDEGFVIRYDNGHRIKIKSARYLELHAILTNIHNKMIFEWLKKGFTIQDVVDIDIPDELFSWIEDVYSGFGTQLDAIRQEVYLEYEKYQEIEGKPEFAQAIKDNKWKHYLFCLKDEKHKALDNLILKSIEPTELIRPQFTQKEDMDE